MRTVTEWWGVVIGAENEAEFDLLAALFVALPDFADQYYEDGTMGLHPGPYKPYTGGDNDFETEAEIVGYLIFTR